MVVFVVQLLCQKSESGENETSKMSCKRLYEEAASYPTQTVTPTKKWSGYYGDE